MQLQGLAAGGAARYTPIPLLAGGTTWRWFLGRGQVDSHLSLEPSRTSLAPLHFREAVCQPNRLGCHHHSSTSTTLPNPAHMGSIELAEDFLKTGAAQRDDHGTPMLFYATALASLEEVTAEKGRCHAVVRVTEGMCNFGKFLHGGAIGESGGPGAVSGGVGCNVQQSDEPSKPPLQNGSQRQPTRQGRRILRLLLLSSSCCLVCFLAGNHAAASPVRSIAIAAQPPCWTLSALLRC